MQNVYSLSFKKEKVRQRIVKEAKTMFHLSQNYELGVIALILAFLIFYVPMAYAFIAIRKQHKRNQNK